MTVALYSSYQGTCYSLDASLLGGINIYEINRNIAFSFIDRNARSDFYAGFFTAHLGFQEHFNWCDACFELFSLADYHYFSRGTIRESGAESINLNVKAQVQHMMRTEAGLKGYYEIQCCNYCFAPFLGLSWIGEFPLGDSRQKANFQEQDCVMNIRSYHSLFNFASPEAGFKITRCNGLSFIGSYKGIFNNRTRSHEMEARFEWAF